MSSVLCHTDTHTHAMCDRCGRHNNNRIAERHFHLFLFSIFRFPRLFFALHFVHCRDNRVDFSLSKRFERWILFRFFCLRRLCGRQHQHTLTLASRTTFDFWSTVHTFNACERIVYHTNWMHRPICDGMTNRREMRANEQKKTEGKCV